MEWFCQCCGHEFPRYCTCGDPQELGRMKWAEDGRLLLGGVVLERPNACGQPGDELQWLKVAPMEYINKKVD